MLGGGRNVFQTDPLSSAIGLVRTHKRTCSVCTRGCFVMGVRFVLNDFLFELVVKAPEPNHFPSLSLGPSVDCTIAAALPSAAWPQFNFNQIPTGIWLKFLLNSQLNKQRQTVCPQSCLDRCQCADMNLKSQLKKEKKEKTLTALTFASYAECLHVSFNRFFFFFLSCF